MSVDQAEASAQRSSDSLSASAGLGASEADILRRRRVELGAFLRRRRSALLPQDVGVSLVGRRHVRGLRREEVALLAGISASWYTLLEQGRVERVGAKTLKNVADALRLSALEREHVFMLARSTFEGAPERKPADALFAFVHRYAGGAAFLTSARSDVIAWNPFGDELFGFAGKPQAERNLLAMMARDRRMRYVFPDWSETFRHMIGVFRSNYAYVGGDAFDVLVDELRAESAEFDRAWNDRSVTSATAHVCALRNEHLGKLRFDFLALAPLDHPTYALVVLTRRDD